MQLRESSDDTNKGGLGAVKRYWWSPPAAGWCEGVGMLRYKHMYEAKRIKNEVGIAMSEFNDDVVRASLTRCHSKLRKWNFEDRVDNGGGRNLEEKHWLLCWMSMYMA
jgi:hypothetical protein